MTEYITKDSGTHQEYASGMRRDSQDGKPRFDLIRTKLQPYEEQMITRYARLLARGAEKYSARNWEQGFGEEELDRAKASLLRHTEQLIAGETDEDHAAAVWFNTQAIEYFRWRQEQTDTASKEELIERGRRASEINRQALEKAHAMRRRERINTAAVELMSQTPPPPAPTVPTLDEAVREEFGLDMLESEMTRPLSGARGLFQFMPGNWPRYSPPMAERAIAQYTMKTDGEVVNNVTGQTVIAGVSPEEDDVALEAERKKSLQMGLDRDQRGQ